MGYIRTGIRLLHSCLNWIFILNWTQLRQQKREEVVKVRDRGAGSGERGEAWRQGGYGSLGLCGYRKENRRRNRQPISSDPQAYGRFLDLSESVRGIGIQMGWTDLKTVF